MKKIVIVSNYLHDEQESMLRFTAVLVSALESNGFAFKVWRPPYVFGRLFKATKFQKIAFNVDKYLCGAISVIILRILCFRSIFHIIDHGNSIYSFLLPRRRTLITCHDCIAIEDARFGTSGERVTTLGRFLQRSIVFALRSAREVVAVSGKTAEDLRNLGVYSVDVIHNSIYSSVSRVDHNRISLTLKKFGFSNDISFIFMLGSNLNRKNRLRAIQAFEAFKLKSRSDIKLFFAGKEAEGAVKECIQKSAYKADIFYLGTIDDDSLSAFYSACNLFLFPSLAEGFGVPIIEAQACGALVVTSNISPMTEIAGDGAVFVDPFSINSICDGIELALLDDGRLRDLGISNSKKFSCKEMTEKYFSKYKYLDKIPE